MTNLEAIRVRAVLVNVLRVGAMVGLLWFFVRYCAATPVLW